MTRRTHPSAFKGKAATPRPRIHVDEKLNHELNRIVRDALEQLKRPDSIPSRIIYDAMLKARQI